MISIERLQRLEQHLLNSSKKIMLINAFLLFLIAITTKYANDLVWLILGVILYGFIYAVFFLLGKWLSKKKKILWAFISYVPPFIVSCMILFALIASLIETSIMTGIKYFL